MVKNDIAPLYPVFSHQLAEVKHFKTPVFRCISHIMNKIGVFCILHDIILNHVTQAFKAKKIFYMPTFRDPIIVYKICKLLEHLKFVQIVFSRIPKTQVCHDSSIVLIGMVHIFLFIFLNQFFGGCLKILHSVL